MNFTDRTVSILVNGTEVIQYLDSWFIERDRADPANVAPLFWRGELVLNKVWGGPNIELDPDKNTIFNIGNVVEFFGYVEGGGQELLAEMIIFDSAPVTGEGSVLRQGPELIINQLSIELGCRLLEAENQDTEETDQGVVDPTSGDVSRVQTAISVLQNATTRNLTINFGNVPDRFIAEVDRTVGAGTLAAQLVYPGSQQFITCDMQTVNTPIVAVRRPQLSDKPKVRWSRPWQQTKFGGFVASNIRPADAVTASSETLEKVPLESVAGGRIFSQSKVPMAVLFGVPEDVVSGLGYVTTIISFTEGQTRKEVTQPFGLLFSLIGPYFEYELDSNGDKTGNFVFNWFTDLGGLLTRPVTTVETTTRRYAGGLELGSTKLEEKPRCAYIRNFQADPNQLPNSLMEARTFKETRETISYLSAVEALRTRVINAPINVLSKGAVTIESLSADTTIYRELRIQNSRSGTKYNKITNRREPPDVEEVEIELGAAPPREAVRDRTGDTDDFETVTLSATYLGNTGLVSPVPDKIDVPFALQDELSNCAKAYYEFTREGRFIAQMTQTYPAGWDGKSIPLVNVGDKQWLADRIRIVVSRQNGGEMQFGFDGYRFANLQTPITPGKVPEIDRVGNLTYRDAVAPVNTPIEPVYFPYTITGGALPPGLSLVNDFIVGTPTTTGNFTVTYASGSATIVIIPELESVPVITRPNRAFQSLGIGFRVRYDIQSVITTTLKQSLATRFAVNSTSGIGPPPVGQAQDDILDLETIGLLATERTMIGEDGLDTMTMDLR